MKFTLGGMHLNTMKPKKITKTFQVELEIETLKNVDELKRWLNTLGSFGIYIKIREIKNGKTRKKTC